MWRETLHDPLTNKNIERILDSLEEIQPFPNGDNKLGAWRQWLSSAQISGLLTSHEYRFISTMIVGCL